MFRIRRASPFTIMLMGGMIFLIGLIWLGVTVKFVRHANRTMGMITEITKHAGMTHTTTRNGVVTHRESQPVYRPIIRFYDREGNLRDVMESVGTSWKQWEANQAVPILYAPEDPSNACIDSFVSVWMFPLVTVGMGALFVMIGKMSKRMDLVHEGGTEI